MASETSLGAWEVASESEYAGVALDARAGQKGHSSTSRGRPARFQGDRGVREFGMVMLGFDPGAWLWGRS